MKKLILMLALINTGAMAGEISEEYKEAMRCSVAALEMGYKTESDKVMQAGMYLEVHVNGQEDKKEAMSEFDYQMGFVHGIYKSLDFQDYTKPKNRLSKTDLYDFYCSPEKLKHYEKLYEESKKAKQD